MNTKQFKTLLSQIRATGEKLDKLLAAACIACCRQGLAHGNLAWFADLEKASPLYARARIRKVAATIKRMRKEASPELRLQWHLDEEKNDAQARLQTSVLEDELKARREKQKEEREARANSQKGAAAVKDAVAEEQKQAQAAGKLKELKGKERGKAGTLKYSGATIELSADEVMACLKAIDEMRKSKLKAS